MPRSIQTYQQYEAEKNRWDDFQNARRSGVPTLQGAASEPIPPKPPDDYADRLGKYVPAEVITLYLALLGAVAQALHDPTSVEWLANRIGDNWLWWFNQGAFVAGLIATPLYLWFRLKVRSIPHILICMGSFVVWAIAIPDGLFKDWPPVIRGLVLPIYTFAVAFYQPTQGTDG